VPTFGPDDGGLRERFFREARAAATLHHPNLCPVFDVGECDGVYYLTMAYIEGKPLSAYIRADKPLSAQQAAGLVRVLAKALQEAHDHGIIHRDLKPANILMSRKKQPVVTDFGLARRAASQEPRLTHSGAMMGTPAYMPPEQVNGDVAAMGPGCDIYSLGVILYELLTGRRPFDGPMGALLAQIVMNPPPPLTEFRPDLDPALEAVCLKALAKRPEDRYPSMRAFGAELEKWLAGKAAATPALYEIEPAAPERPADPHPSKTPAAARRSKVTATPERRPTASPRRPRKGSSRGFSLSGGQRWFLLVCGIIFVTCILPVGAIVLMGVRTIDQLIHGASQAGKWLDDQKKEQEKLREEQKAVQQQWEEIARTWQPPPADAGPARLFPTTVGKYGLTENDTKADIPQLNVARSGLHARYRGPVDTVDLFVYRADRSQKESILRAAQGALNRQGALPVPFPGASNIQGSPEGTSLSYELTGAGGTAEQRGIFWWDQDWLFLARSTSSRDTGPFLKDYLAAFGRKPGGTPP
jgi:hypothetical protein